MNSFERITKKFFQNFGILVRKYNPGTSEELRRIKLLQHYHIDLVFDIGANRGQYATGLKSAGFTGRIVSFEPLSDMHKLLDATSKKYTGWTVAPRCAIGSKKEEIEINISANAVSSTLLKMLDTHLDGAPESKIIGTEKVQVVPLDEAGPTFVKNEKNIFLKIDVQGFEQEVLKGAQQFIEKVKGIEMEISLVPLYEGQTWLLPQILEYMQQKGFQLRSITPAFTDHKTGDVLQCDGIFFRK
ncbi:MAG TPA: FkbM family methyltransferase [Bacteroidia bacterium]|jgi:FkbM family methyltransferase|nr:FkbM family methyltransferase [Bacteroidia bacterium]